MSNTKQEILALGEEFIRTKGYHAFSYKDIAEVLNVKNAAIHYHFPTKEDLGVAIIQKTIVAFEELSDQWQWMKPTEQLDAVIDIYVRSHSKNWSCLMGALSVSIVSLPITMQNKLNEMAEVILLRVTETMDAGLASGEFEFTEAPRIKAQLIISSLLSSLFLNRVLKENIFESIVLAIRKSIKPLVNKKST